METLIICVLIILLIVTFAVTGCKIANKMDGISKEIIAIKNCSILKKCDVIEKNIFVNTYMQAGKKYSKKNNESISKNLFFTYGTIIKKEEDVQIGNDITSIIIKHTIQLNDGTIFERSNEPMYGVNYDKIQENDKVIVFFKMNEDNNCNYVFYTKAQ